MKNNLKITRKFIFLICIILILSLSFTSANLFSDVWNKITGKAIDSQQKIYNDYACFNSAGQLFRSEIACNLIKTEKNETNNESGLVGDELTKQEKSELKLIDSSKLISKNKDVLSKSEKDLFSIPESKVLKKDISKKVSYDLMWEISSEDSAPKIKKQEIEIELPNYKVSGISVSGNVNVFSSLGFARIIAIDEKGLEWLVFDNDFLFVEKAEFENVCEETCLLEPGIKIKEIRIEVLDADLKINKIYFQPVSNKRKDKTSTQLRKQQHNVKLDLVKDFVKEKNYSWTSGETEVSKWLYRDLKKMQYETDSLRMPYDFFFYKGGIYEIDSTEINKKGDENLPIEENTWTEWFNGDNPSGTGDYEDMNSLRKKYDFCESPTEVECQTTTGLDYSKTGEVVSCSLTNGLVCKNSNQPDGKCNYDYKIRFNCGDEIIPEINCFDSDDGKNYFIKGNISGLDSSGSEIIPTSDYCVDSENYNLLEYYCENNQVKGVTHNCLNGCEDGACKTRKCFDSDTQNYYSKGYGYDYKNYFPNNPLRDMCSNSNYLKEAICSPTGSENIIYKSHFCSNGCSDGKCKKQTVFSWVNNLFK